MDKNSTLALRARFAVLPVIFGVVTTLVTYTGFGVEDHIEQLPAILRALDPTFLVNDFFTNASAHAIARQYYAALLAALAGSERNLPLVFLLLTLCANIAIALITFYFARDLFRQSNRAGLFASALVMSVSIFKLGWSSTIYMETLIPSTLAVPLILAAIWAVARGRVLAGILLCGIASIVHPLLGLEMGALLLLAYAVVTLIAQRAVSREGWRKLLPGGLILAGFSLVSLVPQFSQPAIDPQRFIDIVAYFRHPHHYLPSTFDPFDYLFAAAFLGAVLLIYVRFRSALQAPANKTILVLTGVILLLCLGGYLFVERIPSRLWTTAQTFRLLYFVKWIGLVLISGAVADRSQKRSARLLYLAGAAHPLSLGMAALSQWIKARLEASPKWAQRIFDPLIVLLAVTALYGVLSVPLLPILLLVLYSVLIAAYRSVSPRLFYAALIGVILMASATAFLYNRIPYLDQSEFANRIARNLSPALRSSLGPEADAVAAFARDHTQPESVFMTPPDWGEFRLRARRAIVVDFKAFPFTDAAMQAWYDRMLACYGMPTASGFDMIDELDRNYSQISDNDLVRLRQDYHFDYAVLFNQTPTSFEVIYQNEKYKLVALDRNRADAFPLHSEMLAK